VLFCILHDWDDARAGRILDTLRRAMSARARLLVAEYVLPDGDGASLGKWLDVHMMVVLGAAERTEAEYRRLFAAHGFRPSRSGGRSGRSSRRPSPRGWGTSRRPSGW
jgi:hypothetical protein